jgi:hypothetical protein
MLRVALGEARTPNRLLFLSVRGVAPGVRSIAGNASDGDVDAVPFLVDERMGVNGELWIERRGEEDGELMIAVIWKNKDDSKLLFGSFTRCLAL